MGQVHVDEMLQRMPAGLFQEWMAYDALDPIGDRRADWRSALIASVIANVNRDPKKPAFKISDFLLQFERPERRRKSSAEMLAMFKMLTTSPEPVPPADWRDVAIDLDGELDSA